MSIIGGNVNTFLEKLMMYRNRLFIVAGIWQSFFLAMAFIVVYQHPSLVYWSLGLALIPLILLLSAIIFMMGVMVVMVIKDKCL